MLYACAIGILQKNNVYDIAAMHNTLTQQQQQRQLAGAVYKIEWLQQQQQQPPPQPQQHEQPLPQPLQQVEQMEEGEEGRGRGRGGAGDEYPEEGGRDAAEEAGCALIHMIGHILSS